MDFICYLSKYCILYFEFIVKCGKLKMEDVMNYLVDLENVTKLYGNKVALNNVTLKLVPGKIVGLLGPNGSGRTHACARACTCTHAHARTHARTHACMHTHTHGPAWSV